MFTTETIMNVPGRVLTEIKSLDGEPYTASINGVPASLTTAYEWFTRIAHATPERVWKPVVR